jgi:hypothetical protein
MRPDLIEAEIIDGVEQVSFLLESWGLSKAGILAVRDASQTQFVDASPLMALNAPGTLAYHYGILEMRVQFIGKLWEIDRHGGIEAISTASKDRKLIFQNVDVACSRVVDPKPRSEKGAGSERECQDNLFEFYGIVAPKKVRSDKGAKAIHFIMVDERGAVEVSRPVLEGGKFTGFIQRLFVSDGSDLEQLKISGAGIDEPIDDFDVAISNR